jgi:dipeptidyl aminopeptidase/acylaminoacyl peptidase
VDTKLVVVPGAGHGFGGPDIQKQVSEFFGKHLKSASR